MTSRLPGPEGALIPLRASRHHCGSSATRQYAWRQRQEPLARVRARSGSRLGCGGDAPASVRAGFIRRWCCSFWASVRRRASDLMVSSGRFAVLGSVESGLAVSRPAVARSVVAAPSRPCSAVLGSRRAHSVVLGFPSYSVLVALGPAMLVRRYSILCARFGGAQFTRARFGRARFSCARSRRVRFGYVRFSCTRSRRARFTYPGSAVLGSTVLASAALG
jgi:hypothetical protein